MELEIGYLASYVHPRLPRHANAGETAKATKATKIKSAAENFEAKCFIFNSPPEDKIV